MIDRILNNRYQINKKIGKGGMAVVYEATDLMLNRKVAVKVLRSEHVADKNFIKKFQQEAQAVARISHPNVVSIFDIGQDEDYYYLVMEFLEGENLKDIIRKREKLTITEALDITRQICSALMVAHKNDIIHCDIKPHNIIITPDKTIKVTDFGIARAVTTSTLTITDTIMGSAHYFSPEQARGGTIKAYSDLYSLGIVLYEMLTGQVPFQGESPISVALQHIQKKPAKPSRLNEEIPPEVDELVMKALEKKPEKRFSSAVKMKEQITCILKSLQSAKNEQQLDLNDYSSEDFEDTKILNIDELKNKNKALQKNNATAKKIEKEKKLTKKAKIVNKSTEKQNKKSRKVLIFSALIILLLLGSMAFLYNMYRGFTGVPVVEVPDLVGRTVTSARSLASQSGLEVNVQNEIYDHEIDEGSIISQNPASGIHVRQSRVIQLIVSKGPELIEMPEIKGMSLREAEVFLANQGLNIGEKEIKYDPDLEENMVVGQEPAVGDDINTGESIKLVISGGPRPEMVLMPDIIGLNQEEAEEKVNNNNLSLGEITTRESRRYLAGQIIETQYQPGSEIPKGSSIDLTVSEGIINHDNSDIHQQTVKLTVLGFEQQEVVIEVEDDNGVNVAYRGSHTPGDNIEEKVISVGITTFRVYMNDRLIHEETIGD